METAIFTITHNNDAITTRKPQLPSTILRLDKQQDKCVNIFFYLKF